MDRVRKNADWWHVKGAIVTPLLRSTSHTNQTGMPRLWSMAQLYAQPTYTTSLVRFKTNMILQAPSRVESQRFPLVAATRWRQKCLIGSSLPLAGSRGVENRLDNMEGLAVHQTRAGQTVLTIILDENFSAIQRTELLQFTLGRYSKSIGRFPTR